MDFLLLKIAMNLSSHPFFFLEIHLFTSWSKLFISYYKDLIFQICNFVENSFCIWINLLIYRINGIGHEKSLVLILLIKTIKLHLSF